MGATQRLEGHVSVPPCPTLLHVPVLFAHVLHAAVHASLQQVESAQLFERQSPPLPHGWPLTFLQLPWPSQRRVPSHALTGVVSSDPEAMKVVHVPDPFAHE
jgi:hypothetical protein